MVDAQKYHRVCFRLKNVILCIETYTLCKLENDFLCLIKMKIFYKLFNLCATAIRVNFAFQLQWKQLKIVFELLCMLLLFTTKPYVEFYYIILLTCISHCENIEKRFPLYTKIAFSNIFAHALTWKIYCGTLLPLDVFIYSYIKGANLRSISS